LHFIDNPVEDIKNTIKALKNPKFKERAQDLAEKLVEKIPLIYASERMGVVAYRWKTQFNENAKIHAFCHVFPELDHNELVGYDNIKAGYHVIIIKDDDDYVKIKKRMDITKRLISEAGINVTEMVIKGDCFLTKLFSAIYLGDLTSYYLALKYGTDPTPVDVIELLVIRIPTLLELLPAPAWPVREIFPSVEITPPPLIKMPFLLLTLPKLLPVPFNVMAPDCEITNPPGGTKIPASPDISPPIPTKLTFPLFVEIEP